MDRMQQDDGSADELRLNNDPKWHPKKESEAVAMDATSCPTTNARSRRLGKNRTSDQTNAVYPVIPAAAFVRATSSAASGYAVNASFAVYKMEAMFYVFDDLRPGSDFNMLSSGRRLLLAYIEWRTYMGRSRTYGFIWLEAG